MDATPEWDYVRRLSTSQKTFRIRRQGKLERSRRAYRLKRQMARRQIHVRKVEGTYLDFHRIRAPKVFGLSVESERSNVLNFLKNLRDTVGIQKKHVLIDFSETETLIADAMLLAYAEITRLVARFSREVKIRCILPKKSFSTRTKPFIEKREKVAQVLKQIGLLDLLGNQAKVEPTYEDVVHWKAVHGYKVQGDITEPILQVVDDVLGEMVSRKLYTGVSEAMTNTTHHAYLEDRHDGLNLKDKAGWWMFLQVKDNMLSILMCDLGIGIPRSLPKTNRDWLHKLFSEKYPAPDSLSIKYATEYGRTSTNLSNRGKGLKKMLSIVESLEASSLRIHSNKGVFTAGKITHIVSRDYQDSIMGTLISWNIPISENAEGESTNV
ncbi:hypothetical protein [Deinococcus sp. Leaf326]|uniref:hypothetical protein n=1 Tax=Deinococcus sp. Leaf326 TaxID=1736338 RepID=UPI000A8C5C56|nr:hypothetical protein [Deinococcus sp. Leaf326]